MCHKFQGPFGDPSGRVPIVNDLSGDHGNRVRIEVVNQLLLCQVHLIEYLLDAWVSIFALDQYLTKKVHRSLNGMNVAFVLSLYNYSHADHLSGSRDV
jgi:hypothetical protein